MAYTYDDFQITKSGAILEVVLNRPDSRNALKREMDHDWDAVLDEAEADEEVRVIMLRGAGKVFCAGHDLKQPRAATPPSAVPAMPRAWYFSKPIVAAVHGYVGGAGNTLLFGADFIIAAEGTKFAFEMYRGGGAAPTFLSLLFPMRVAKKLFMMGGWFDAEQALRFDYVQRVVPVDQVLAEAARWAEHLANIAPKGVQGSKQGIHLAYEIMLDLPNVVSIKDHARLPTRVREPGAPARGDSAVKEQSLDEAIRRRDAGFDPDVTRV